MRSNDQQHTAQKFQRCTTRTPLQTRGELKLGYIETVNSF